MNYETTLHQQTYNFVSLLKILSSPVIHRTMERLEGATSDERAFIDSIYVDEHHAFRLKYHTSERRDMRVVHGSGLPDSGYNGEWPRVFRHSSVGFATYQVELVECDAHKYSLPRSHEGGTLYMCRFDLPPESDLIQSTTLHVRASPYMACETLLPGIPDALCRSNTTKNHFMHALTLILNEGYLLYKKHTKDSVRLQKAKLLFRKDGEQVTEAQAIYGEMQDFMGNGIHALNYCSYANRSTGRAEYAYEHRIGLPFYFSEDRDSHLPTIRQRFPREGQKTTFVCFVSVEGAVRNVEIEVGLVFLRDAPRRGIASLSSRLDYRHGTTYYFESTVETWGERELYDSEEAQGFGGSASLYSFPVPRNCKAVRSVVVRFENASTGKTVAPKDIANVALVMNAGLVRFVGPGTRFSEAEPIRNGISPDGKHLLFTFDEQLSTTRVRDCERWVSFTRFDEVNLVAWFMPGKDMSSNDPVRAVIFVEEVSITHSYPGGIAGAPWLEYDSWHVSPDEAGPLYW